MKSVTTSAVADALRAIRPSIGDDRFSATSAQIAKYLGVDRELVNRVGRLKCDLVCTLIKTRVGEQYEVSYGDGTWSVWKPLSVRAQPDESLKERIAAFLDLLCRDLTTKRVVLDEDTARALDALDKETRSGRPNE